MQEKYKDLVVKANEEVELSEGSQSTDQNSLLIEASGGVKKGRIVGMGSEGESRLELTHYVHQSRPISSLQVDGTFKDDLCLVFVYVTAETSDAHGNGFGDSCWFKADRLMLVDSENTEFAVPVSYFSEGWGDLGPQGNPVLSMLPNEINYVAFGFLVNKHNADGTPVDFSTFCVRGTEGDTNDTLIPLGLKN